jgi:hypothetical protein
MVHKITQVTAICVGEKGETPVGSEPASLAITASALFSFACFVTKSMLLAPWKGGRGII